MSGFEPWVLLTLILSALPSLLRLPLWVAGLALAGTLIHYWGTLRKGWRGKAASALMLGGCAAGIWFSYDSVFSGNAVLTFFITVVFLKWGEAHTRRDYLLLIFAAVILSAVGALYFENMLSLIHMLVVVFALTMSLTAIHMDPAALAKNLLFKTAGKLFVLGLPLMLLLFMTFPRIPGPIWDIGIAFGLPIKAMMNRGDGQFGKEMTLQPGGIHRATQDNENVLVAEFKGVVPFISRLYWRGPVFWDFDGQNWSVPEAWDNRNTLMRTAIRSKKKLDYELVYKADPVDYNLRVMPNGSRWLYGLDVPAGPAPEAFISSEFQLLSIRKVNDHEPKFENLHSFLEYRIGKRLDPKKRARALAWPENTNPRLHALGKKLKNELQTPEKIIHEGLSLLAKGNYTFDAAHLVEPGPDMLDRYFFEEKRGGAEYLAGSFAMLLRAADIPARLVSGFRGGTVIALTNFVIVKQANAHVWLEVWEDNMGWHRVEPKDIVQPPGKKRVQPKAEQKPQAQQVQVTPAKAASLPDAKNASRFEKQGTHKKEKNRSWSLPSMSALFGNFQKWIINYDPDRQMEILKGVGMEKSNWLDLMVTGIAGVAGLLGIYLASAWFRGRGKNDRVTVAWQKFLARMDKKFNLEKSKQECPKVYLDRVCSARPELATAVGDIISRYIEIRYTEDHSKKAANLFQRQVARFVSMT
nr:DUF3488 and transglutaminase-like domain-containing protein [uncultured Desulfobacter sp.]